MFIKVSTHEQFFYTLYTNYNKIYKKVYFIYCDKNHVIPVMNNGMERLGDPIKLDPIRMDINEQDFYNKCSWGECKVTNIVLDTP